MNRYVFIVLTCGGLIGLESSAYRRYTYVHHNFSLPEQDSSTLLTEMIENNIVQRKQVTTYSLGYDSSRRDFIYLSRLDRWRIVRALRKYEKNEYITRDLIEEITASLWGKRRVVVHHVLRDLSKDERTTVGSILEILGVDSLG